MFVRLLRNTPRQAARLARQQHNRLVTRGAVVETQQRYQSTAAAPAPYFEVDVVEGGIAVVRMDQPNSPVNTINVSMQDEFASVLDQIENDANIRAAVLISKKSTCFVAGADIDMINKVTSAEEGAAMSAGGQEMFKRIENSKKPFLAAINGPALGGGLELAMACHYRVATTAKSTKLGLPEVMLGVLPGAGGTQRLIKLVGEPNAFPMILTGAQKDATKAKKMGIVDQIIKPLGPGKISTMEYLENCSIEFAKQLADGTLKRKNKKPNTQTKIVQKALAFGPTRKKFFETQVKAGIMKQTKGLYPAPLKIAEVLEKSAAAGFGTAAGYKAEAEGFGALTMEPVTKAMINIFNARNHCGKNHWGKPEQTPKELAVLGAGLMGAGIAQVSIGKGYNVILKDAGLDGLDAGSKNIDDALQKKVKRRKMSQWDADIIKERLKPTLDYSQIANSDVIIEAVPEILDLKHRIIKEVEAVAKPDHVFATNTSGLLVREIAAAHSNPANVIGMHYFSPVPQMELLEIIVTDETSDETLKRAIAVGLKQKKLIVVAKDVPGFYCNRCLAPALKEVLRMFQEGVDPNKINKLSGQAGFAVGTATLIDEVGVDIAMHAAKNIGCNPMYGARMNGGDVTFLDALIEGGAGGKKDKKGVFDYTDKKKKGVVSNVFKDVQSKFAIEPTHGATSDDELVDRILLRYTNEAALCIQEEVIRTPQEGDVAAIFGTGYPPCKGGPFMYMDTVGAQNIVDRLNHLQDKIGEEFAPSQILIDMAKSGDKFY